MKITSKNRKQKGWTLLELLVVLSIVGVALAGVARALAPGQIEGRVSEARQHISEIDSAANRYGKAHPNQMTDISMEELTDNGYLAAAFEDGTAFNPWEGNYTVAVGDEAYQYVITLTNVVDGCEQLAGNYADVNAVCDADANTVTIPRG